MYYQEKEKIVSLDKLKLYRGGGEHIIQEFEDDELPDSIMNRAELTEIPNLEERGENLLNPRTDSGEGEGREMDNSGSPAVGRGSIDQEMENVIIRIQTDQTAEKEMIREDKEDVDMEEKGEGRGRPSSPEE